MKGVIIDQTISPSEFPLQPIILDKLSIGFMKTSCILPISLIDGTLKVVMANPDDFQTIQTLELAYGLKVEVMLGNRDDILDAIDRLYGEDSQPIETIIEEAERGISDKAGTMEEDTVRLRDKASRGPIIRLVNRLIVNAVESRSSDIHFEPYENELRIRYRIDGILRDVETAPVRVQAAIISRVKIMAHLNISEHRLPQDGRVKLIIAEKEIDFRISTVPTLHGESVVMRILDQQNLILDIQQLGFPKYLLPQYCRLIAQPHGMVLVTGPTGSGKTTTLYASLSSINREEKKIITLEDPVEYQLKGINQIQVQPKLGLTFANGLRSIVRQDPDVILVGEIRDEETAHTAVQSALTGHLLFSTLHTNDSAGAITRLLDMGVESFLLSSTLLGVFAQRLVRVICNSCKKEDLVNRVQLNDLGFKDKDLSEAHFAVGSGCPDCRDSGYFGRTAIFEYLPIGGAIRKEIDLKSTTEKIRQVASQIGMVTLRNDGMEKAWDGITTVSEVIRTTSERINA